jgi:PAS domain S-box-containing protein
MLGVRPEDGETTRDWWFERIHPEDAPRFHAALDAMLEGRAPDLDLEYRMRHKAGGWIWIWQRGLVVRDATGRLKRTVGAILDITERKRAEEALRTSEERFQYVARATRDVIWDLDLVADRTWWSEAMQRELGFAPEDIGSEAAWCFSHMHPEDRKRVMRGMKEAVEGRGNYWSDEFRYRRANGTYAYISDRGFIIRDAQGQASRIIGAMQDITERVQAEEELRRFASDLERRVEERTRQLVEVNRELNAFAYSVSHDLRAPMRHMEGYAEVLAEDYGDKLDEHARAYLERIVAAAHRMNGLIEDLLAYSRLSKDEIVLQPTKLSKLVERIVHEMTPELEACGARTEIVHPLPTVRAHPTILHQAITNLVTNAIKFMAPGVTPRIRICAEERDGEKVRLWVEDNGIGIAPEHHERIFGVFERLHGRESVPGSGIGLAIVRKGLERMGGSVGVASEVGKGSRFWIELA